MITIKKKADTYNQICFAIYVVSESHLRCLAIFSKNESVKIKGHFSGDFNLKQHLNEGYFLFALTPASFSPSENNCLLLYCFLTGSNKCSMQKLSLCITACLFQEIRLYLLLKH